MDNANEVVVVSVEPDGFAEGLGRGNAFGGTVRVTLRRGKQQMVIPDVLIWEDEQEQYELQAVWEDNEMLLEDGEDCCTIMTLD
jgi:hypothetical protein